CATAEAQRQTGEKTLSMRVWEIGLGSSLRRCVTTKAVAVTTSSSRARIVGAFLFIGARLYAAHTGGRPDDERGQPDAPAQATPGMPGSAPRPLLVARTPSAEALPHPASLSPSCQRGRRGRLRRAGRSSQRPSNRTPCTRTNARRTS